MKTVYYILFALGLLSAVACSKEYGLEETQGGEGRLIEFTLANATADTRAIEDPLENEKAINRLDIFFFNEAGTCIFYPTGEQLSQTGMNVTINIPEEYYQANLVGKECTIYIMANSNLPRATLTDKTLTQLMDLEMENGDDRRFNTVAAPVDFLMTGSTEATIVDEQSQKLGETITLKRTAAKVAVNIANASIEGSTYTAETVKARMVNYLDNGKISGGDFDAAQADYLTAEKALQRSGMSFSTGEQNSFYTYPNDWNGDIGRETYIVLEVVWKSQADELITSFYRVPFTYIQANDEAGDHANRIRSNFVYQFFVNISDFGGIDPQHAVDIEANFDIMDWSTDEVAVSILEYHYLFVYSPDIRTNAETHEWEYRSSLPAEIEITRAWCMVYTNNGVTVPDGRVIEYDAEDFDIVRRTEGDRTLFGIEGAWIPNNYVPLIIEITLSNSANLTAGATLTVLPGEYVTATRSVNTDKPGTGSYPAAGAYSHPTSTTGDGNYGSNNQNGGTGQTNFNFYEITITSVPNQQIWVGGVWRNIMIGDPTMEADKPTGTWTHVDGFEYIKTDPDKNHIVSPSFVVASQRGITATNRNWAQGQDRCSRYRESQYPAGTWRAPTFAELAMLAVMQNDDNSAIKSLFNAGTGYWFTALPSYRIQVGTYSYSYNGVGQAVANDGSAAIRCVRDTWKVYDQDDYGVYGD